MAANKVVYGTLVLMDLTSDTVTAEQMPQGCTAHDKSGAKITGTLPFTAKGKDRNIVSDAVLSTDSDVVLSVYINKTATSEKPPFAMLGDNILRMYSPKSNFGDATDSDVVKGKTFTSSAGVKVRGTLAEGTPKVSYDNSRNMSWRQIQTAYGTMNIIDIPVNINAGNTPIVVSGTIAATISSSGINFGNATAADVAKGTTFTSNAGVKLTGTLETSGGDKVYAITDPSNPAVGIPDGIVQIYGYAKDSSFLYAFCGNRFYKRNSKGSDTSMRTTFSVKNGVIARFPSGLTECNLIAVQSS